MAGSFVGATSNHLSRICRRRHGSWETTTSSTHPFHNTEKPVCVCVCVFRFTYAYMLFILYIYNVHECA